MEEREENKLKYVDSGIHPDILKAILDMGFEVMTPIQEQAIPVLLEGKDIIGRHRQVPERQQLLQFP